MRLQKARGLRQSNTFRLGKKAVSNPSLNSDAPFLKLAGISGFDDPRYEKYSQRVVPLRGIRKYVCLNSPLDV